YVDGKINLTEYILSNKQETFQQTPDTKPKDTAVIPQGQRNNTLHKFALSVLTKYGETDTVYNLYLKESQKCSPLLTEKEVQSIWNAAVNYYNGTIKVQSDYIEPSIYQKASSATLLSVKLIVTQ
ncbi:MAG: primase alpha helix C-terminal domain-containing protein, partial [Schaedlerella sp.]|uniref:primase alpha helix C-terminal domain-containing protein n=1 Tax=Schaedlerella sp. TaxID=2676057 RepID=UPI0035280283